MGAAAIRHNDESDDNLEKLRQEFEVVLDENLETGIRRVQVWVWLIFEDATHSKLGRLVQSWVFLCIFLSTTLELVMSYSPCEWKPWYEVSFQLSGADAASMTFLPGVPTDTYTLAAQPPGMPDIVRVCEPRPKMRDEWVGYFVMEAVCILSFTFE